jgi:antitoxin ParD1/3/4
MTTLKLSLPEFIQAFIDEQVAKGIYSSANEYILHLIYQDQEQAAQVQIESLLLEGIDSGEPMEVTDEWWEEKQTALVEQLRHPQG